ncbi:MAG TPA: PAS domain-containing sensor histidine kinase [Geobacter sp.]|nr:PAS domain-containing sensor histidine kinase [Geobacter sp.]
MHTHQIFNGKLPSLRHLIVTQLLLTCTVETLVHFFMPLVIPDTQKAYQGIADALLLLVITAPFVWAIIARAATDLEERREFSLKLVQDSAVPCFVLAPDHKVLVWNKACEALTGIRATEVIGTDRHWRGFYEHWRPTLADVVLDGAPLDLYARCAKSTFGEDGLQCEKWLRNEGGKDQYLFFDAVPIRSGKGEVIAVIETLQDLTERKSAEESLEKSEEKFFKAFHASPDGIVINTKAEGLFIEANEAFVGMLGYTREEIIGHSSVELGLWVDPAERAIIIDQTDREGAVRNVEVSIRVKSGLIRTFLWSSDTIDLKDRECLIVTVRDVTDQKENERQLLRSQAELTSKHEELSALFGQVESVKREWEKTMDCINEMVILLAPDGRVKRCNRATVEFMGVPYGEIIGQKWQQLLEKTELFLPSISEERGFYCCDFPLEPSKRWLSVTYYPDSDVGELGQPGAVVTINDITERKRAALELAQAYTELKETHNQMIEQEKMASIGQLAAGVAHEINNPTGYIISNLGTLAKYQARLVDFIQAQSEIIDSLDSSEQSKMASLRKQMKIDYIVGDLPDLVSESLDGAERIKNIVQSLKCFSRKNDTCTTASIADCLESTINIIWNEIKYKATLKKEFGDLPAIRCYPQKLSQVFMNLIVNAAHAIEEKGEITVSAWQENSAIYVTVTDTGSGIPEEIRSRIFEPFFTTKEVGKGTGLGLSISCGIVREHGGEITVESTVGTGTTFTVMLPLNGVQED